MRSSTWAPPAAASTPSLLQRQVEKTSFCVHHSQHVGIEKMCISLPVFYFNKAGLMLSRWKLPQSLVKLGFHLRSQLSGGRSLSGGLTESGVKLI